MNAAEAKWIPQSPSWTGSISPAAWLRIAIIAALVFAAYWGPIRYYLVGQWIADGNWSHGWLIPLFSVYFLVTRREVLARCTPRPNYFGAVILAFSLAAYFWSAWRAKTCWVVIVRC